MDNRPQCPRCGSGNLKKASARAFWLTYLLGAGFLLWFGLMLPTFWMTATILLLFSAVMFLAGETFQCQDCKHTWLFRKKDPGSGK